MAETLGDIGSDKGIVPLIRLFKDTDFNVRRNATEALVKIGNNKVVKHLIQVLQDEDYKVRLRAEWTLRKIVIGETLELRAKELKDKNFNVICQSIKPVGNETIQSILYTLKMDESVENFKLKNLLELDSISSDRTIESLENYVLKNLVERLSNAGSNRISKSLIQVPKDKHFDVQDNLVGIVSMEIVETSIKALKDENYYVRVTAVEELERMTKAAHNLPALTQQLPHLIPLIPTEASQQAISVITAIQARCKYYNYNIAKTSLQETENHASPLENTLNEITKAIENMSDAPKYDLRGAKIDKLIPLMRGSR